MVVARSHGMSDATVARCAGEALLQPCSAYLLATVPAQRTSAGAARRGNRLDGRHCRAAAAARTTACQAKPSKTALPRRRLSVRPHGAEGSIGKFPVGTVRQSAVRTACWSATIHQHTQLTRSASGATGVGFSSSAAHALMCTGRVRANMFVSACEAHGNMPTTIVG